MVAHLDRPTPTATIAPASPVPAPHAALTGNTVPTISGDPLTGRMCVTMQVRYECRLYYVSMVYDRHAGDLGQSIHDMRVLPAPACADLPAIVMRMSTVAYHLSDTRDRAMRRVMLEVQERAEVWSGGMRAGLEQDATGGGVGKV